MANGRRLGYAGTGNRRGAMAIRRGVLGDFQGRPVESFVLKSGSGLGAELITWGAVLRRLTLGGVDLVLGLERFEDYPSMSPYLGATVGRFANRIGGGRFTLDGRTYELSRNQDGRHTLHGGADNLARRVWTAEVDEAANAVRFGITSPDGDQGFSGRLEVACTYALRDEVLAIEMTATTDAPTPVNLVHHSYWNLAGSGTIDRHVLLVEADRYLPVDGDTVSTGEILGVEGTQLDFRIPRRLDALGDPIIDHCLVLTGKPGLRRVARLEDPASGRFMELSANQPGVQVYTGFKLDLRPSAGPPIGPRAGLCLETEGFPNAPNEPRFPDSILRPGETYRHLMEHRFGRAPG
jgi:aldose 1-epimerase